MIFGLNTNQLLSLTALGVLLLLGLLVVVVLFSGLFKARSLLRREFSAYFFSPFAYVMLVGFLAITGVFFTTTLRQLTASGPVGTEHPMQVMLGDQWKYWWVFWLVFLVIPSLLTMRLFAEERSTGTLEMLMTTPIKDWQVVAAKYVACLGFYVLLWLPTLAYLPVLLDLHTPIVHFEWNQVTVQPVWTLYSIIFLSGLGAAVLGLLLALLPLGKRGRILALTLFLLGVLTAGAGGWAHFTFDSRILIEVAAGSVWSPFAILLLGGLAALVLAGVLALFAFSTASRTIGLALFLAGLVAVGAGAWGHYHYDDIHLLEVPAGIDPMPVISSYLGLFFAGAMFLSLGLFISSLVRSQMVAALVSLILSLVFIVAGFWRTEMDTSSLFYQLVYFFSVPLHFSQDFSRGLIDTRHLVLYGSVTVFCLFLTVRSLESRRWRA
jgi:ABC-type transport system involved in multi-copper enzyme maturation permease subunit